MSMVLPRDAKPIIVVNPRFSRKHANPWCDRDEDFEDEGFESEEEREGWNDLAKHFAEM